MIFRTLVVIAIGALTNLSAANVFGRWTGPFETPDGPKPLSITLLQHDGVITGMVTWNEAPKPLRVERPRVDGSHVTFETHDEANQIGSFTWN